MRRVALATAATWSQLDRDSALLLPALAELGVHAEAAVWDDPEIDWSAYDLVVVRSTWDYVPRRDAFLAWARGVPALHNPADVLAWNTDKTYLRELGAAGVPVVPTTYVAPGEPYEPPDGDVVVKPTVSAGARDTERYRDARAAAPLVARLHAQGRTVMVQPYLSGVDADGETAVLLFGGEPSHGARKVALLAGPPVALDDGPAVMSPRQPTGAQVELARAALAAVPHDRPLLYARVDLVPGLDGSPVVLELELTEPSLFLRYAPGSAQRCARAVAALLP